MELFVSELTGSVPVTKIRVDGDLSDGDKLKSVVETAIENGSRHILLDLTDVPFVSSSGLRGIHDAFERLNAVHNIEGRTLTKGIASGTYKSPYLKLVNPSKNAKRALSVGGFDMFLEMHSDESTAVHAFS